MRYLILVKFFMLVAVSSAYSQPTIKYEKAFNLIPDNDYYLGAPSQVLVADDKIYVSDLVDFKVKVFNKKGVFQFDFAGRGRGPGEFLNYTTSWSDSRNLFFIDMFNAKIVKFNSKGMLEEEKKLDIRKILWPRLVVPTKDQFILLYVLNTSNDIFHIWDKDFSKEMGTFSVTALEDDYTDIDYRVMGFKPGSSIVFRLVWSSCCYL